MNKEKFSHIVEVPACVRRSGSYCRQYLSSHDLPGSEVDGNWPNIPNIIPENLAMLTVTGGYLNTVAVREVDVVPDPVNGQPLGMVQIPVQYLTEVYSRDVARIFWKGEQYQKATQGALLIIRAASNF